MKVDTHTSMIGAWSVKPVIFIFYLHKDMYSCIYSIKQSKSHRRGQNIAGWPHIPFKLLLICGLWDMTLEFLLRPAPAPCSSFCTDSNLELNSQHQQSELLLLEWIISIFGQSAPHTWALGAGMESSQSPLVSPPAPSPVGYGLCWFSIRKSIEII